MRQILTFLIIIIFCACKQKSESTNILQDTIPAGKVYNSGTLKSEEKVKNKTFEITMLEWKQHEDSLRDVILRQKENNVLKESFLQEMYIRNVVGVSNDSLFLTIPFNLHAADCGAPDCYTTEISFSFKLDDILTFPKSIQFREQEYGCVDTEKQISGNFELVEQTDKHVIYHSAKHKRTLVLFSSNNETGTTAYYFTEVGRNRINGNNLHTIMKDYNEEDENSIYPFTSWILSTNDYEYFLKSDQD